mgnify:CR=1 FL=1
MQVEVEPEAGKTARRSYTIASSPTQRAYVELTVKREEQGVVSRYLHDKVVADDLLKVSGPFGAFTFTGTDAQSIVLIAGGVGITPMMSMVTDFYDRGRTCDIVFVNCARKPSEIIFRERLEHMASRIEGLDLRWVVAERDKYKPWTGYQGQFNQLMLGIMAPDYLEREVFCCGPEGFMTAVREALAGLGFDMEHYHQESFQAPGTPGPELVEAPLPEDDLPEEDVQAEILFDISGVSASCPETDTVLAAARGAGVAIPSGCTFGVCGTCKVKKLEGEVHMVHNGGITEEEIEEGYILACCSNPRGKVTVEL